MLIMCKIILHNYVNLFNISIVISPTVIFKSLIISNIKFSAYILEMNDAVIPWRRIYASLQNVYYHENYPVSVFTNPFP